MTLIGNVATTDVITELEESLRYGANEVKGYHGTSDDKRRDYPYKFETTVFVPPDVLENGHSRGRPRTESAPNTAQPPSPETADATIAPQDSGDSAAVAGDATTTEDVTDQPQQPDRPTRERPELNDGDSAQPAAAAASEESGSEAL